MIKLDSEVQKKNDKYAACEHFAADFYSERKETNSMHKSSGRSVNDVDIMTSLLRDGLLRVRLKKTLKWDSPALEYDKIYTVMSVEKGWYRIMTELDEDYLFPPTMFDVV